MLYIVYGDQISVTLCDVLPSVMEIKFRTFLPIFLFCYLEDSLVQALQSVGTYTGKSVEVLECSFTASAVQWNELRDDGTAIALFSYDVANAQAKKLTSDIKYDNFDYSVEEEENGSSGFNLAITNIDKHDGGRYQCSPFSATPLIFSVTVDVLPESISISCTEVNVCTSSSGRGKAAHISCDCQATGLSSSMLELEWEAVGILTTSNVTSAMDPTSGTISISSKITLLPPSRTSTVSCSLIGYESQIPERLTKNTYSFSPPVCNLVHDCLSDGTGAVLTCDCTDGSPKISAYSFNNSQVSQFYNSSTLKVEAYGKTTFYCNGCNGVMHDQIAELAFNCQKGLPWWFFLIIIGILLALLVLVLVIVVVKKYKTGEVGPKHHKSKDRQEEVPLHRGDVEDPQDMKQKDGPAPKDKDEAKTHLLYENAPIQDQQKVQGPGGMNTVPSSGGSAPKKNDKGMNPEPARSGQAPKKDNNKKTGLKNEAQAKPAGSKGAPSMPTPQTEKSKEQKETEKTALKKEAQAKPASSKGAPSMLTPKTEKSKEQKDSEKEGADRDVSKKDPPKEKTGAKVDPSTNLASKSEVTKNELSKKKEEERLKTGGSGLESKDNRNTEQFEEEGSRVDPEDYRDEDDNTNENSEQATPLSPRTPGDGEPDHAPGIKESANSPGPIIDGLESSVDLIVPGENPAQQQESHDKNGAPQEADTTNNPTSTQRSGHHSVSATPHTEVPQSNPSTSHFDDVSSPNINQLSC